MGEKRDLRLPKTDNMYFNPEVQSQYRVMVHTESDDSESSASILSDETGSKIASDAESFREIPLVTQTRPKTSPESSPNSIRRKKAEDVKTKSVSKLSKYQPKLSPDF